MKKLSLWLLFLMGIVSSSLWAQKYSNEFLSIGVGARAQAMGGAQVATVGDVTAGIWNPAGLMRLASSSDLQIGAMHSEWFAGIGKFDYIAAAMPMPDRKKVLGLSFIRFGVDNIPNTLSLYNSDGTINYDNVTSFSAADYAFLLHYAQSLKNPNLRVGGSLKLINRKVGVFANSWGFGLDIGAQYQINDFHIGLMAKDITTTFNAWKFNFTDAEKQVLQTTNNEIPISSVELTKPSITLGFAYEKQFNKLGLLAETNFRITTDGKRNVLLSANPISMEPLAGLELSYGNIKRVLEVESGAKPPTNYGIFFRTGISNIQRYQNLDGNSVMTLQPNIGAGLQLYSIRLDYALTNMGKQSSGSGLTYSHVISLLIDLNYAYLKKAFQQADQE